MKGWSRLWQCLRFGHTLPITPETEDAVADPVEPGKGLINMGFALGFDADNRPVLSDHKFDEDDNSQIYNARKDIGGCKIYQTSDWNWQWDFGGLGAIPSRLGVSGGVKPTDDGYLSLPYFHEKYGSDVWQLDPDSSWLSKSGMAEYGRVCVLRIERKNMVSVP